MVTTETVHPWSLPKPEAPTKFRFGGVVDLTEDLVVESQDSFQVAAGRSKLSQLYWHRGQARSLFKSIGSHVSHDQHAGRDGFYKIVSRYYDSADLACYRKKVDGEKYRRKVRVRTYGESPDGAFLEIKQRYNLNVQKRRCRFPLEVTSRLPDRFGRD